MKITLQFFFTFFIFSQILILPSLQAETLLKRALNRTEKKTKVEVKPTAEAPNQYTLVDRIIAIVNSEIILESDFKELNKFLQNDEFIDEAIASGMDVGALKTSSEFKTEYLIRDKIMGSEIKRLNLEVTQDRVDSEIKDMSKRAGISSDDVYAAVKSQGFSKAEYRDFLKSKIERQSLIESEVISRLRISDDDALSEYLKKNPVAKSTVDEYSLAHIFFSPKKGSPQEALARAQATLARLRQGEKFETVAEQTSEDPNFSSGGYLGTFKSGEFLKEIEDSIVGLQPNDITAVVKSRMGFHIVKLLNKKNSADPQFEREKEKIKSQLMAQAFRRQMIIWFQNKRDEAYVKINTI